MPIISYDPPDLNPSDQQIAAFQDQAASTNGLFNQLLHKIVYPENLIKANSRYGNQFMALYINITPGGNPFSGAKTPPQVKDVNGSTVSNLTGTLRGGSVINKFTQTTVLDTAAKGGIIRANGQGSQTAYAIYLPVPLNLSTSFGMSYMDSFEPGADAAKLVESQLVGVVGAVGEVASTFIPGFLGSLTGGVTKLLAANVDTLRNTFEANKALAINPHKQMLFKGVALREFDLKYNLVARNQSEANVLDYIIRLLRYYMHPDLDGAFLYRYPDEFDIEFYTLDKNGIGVRNKYLPFFSTCVLKNMTINYGGKEFATHSDGAPVEYELTLKFGETQILNKTVINAFDSDVNGEGLKIENINPGITEQQLLEQAKDFASKTLS